MPLIPQCRRRSKHERTSDHERDEGQAEEQEGVVREMSPVESGQGVAVVVGGGAEGFALEGGHGEGCWDVVVGVYVGEGVGTVVGMGGR